MKSVLFVFIILSIAAILAGLTLEGKIIQVEVVIPPRLVPYYQWLLTFPGINPNPENSIQEQPPLDNTSNA